MAKLHFSEPGERKAVEEGASFMPAFDKDGLVPCVSIDDASGAVLMLAYMNEEALAATLTTGEAHYWSRSRAELWHKGATSGAVQTVVEMRTDCDQDAILLRVRVAKPEATCHTGRDTCFYRRVIAPADMNGEVTLAQGDDE